MRQRAPAPPLTTGAGAGPDARARTQCDRAARARCRFVTVWGSALTLLLVVAWPALALPAKDFSKGYFTFWTIIAIVWGLLASIAMVFMPVRPAPLTQAHAARPL